MKYILSKVQCNQCDVLFWDTQETSLQDHHEYKKQLPALKRQKCSWKKMAYFVVTILLLIGAALVVIAAPTRTGRETQDEAIALGNVQRGLKTILQLAVSFIRKRILCKLFVTAFAVF